MDMDFVAPSANKTFLLSAQENNDVPGNVPGDVHQNLPASPAATCQRAGSIALLALGLAFAVSPAQARMSAADVWGRAATVAHTVVDAGAMAEPGGADAFASATAAEVPVLNVALISHPVQGDTYLLGEVIELALTFDRVMAVDTAAGTPSIELDIGDVRRRAYYVRGGGSRQLVFAYTVQPTDSDTDGIRICGADQLLGCTGSISPNGAALEYHAGLAALLRHPSQPAQPGHKADGSRTGPSGGICGRTKAVRDALARRLGAADCSEVTAAQLRALTGTLSLGGRGVVALRPGDFADLGALQQLLLQNNNLTTLPEGVFTDLSSLEFLLLSYNRLTTLPANVFSGLTALQQLLLSPNNLTELPAGLFDGLDALERLYLNHNQLRALPAGIFSGLGSLEILLLNNNLLTTLPADVFNGLVALRELTLSDNGLTALSAELFAGLGALEILRLQSNRLGALPAGVFRDLVSLVSLRLEGNPDSAGFLPIADAGADRAVDAGQVVTLRALASDADPWGENVAWAWTQLDNGAAMVELTGAGTATISFVMPASAAELEFELRVTGRGPGLSGTRYMDADTVRVRLIPETIVTLSAPPPATTKGIAGDSVTLIFGYSADDLHGRVLAGSIEVAAAVDGAAVTPSVNVDETSGRGTITIVLRRESLSGPR